MAATESPCPTLSRCHGGEMAQAGAASTAGAAPRRHNRARLAAAVLCAALLAAPGPAAATLLGPYDYPFVNPLAATVAATPTPYRADLPPVESLGTSSRSITVLPERRIPDVYWYFRDGLQYTLTRQRGPAPLVFVISGTGAAADSVKSAIVVSALAQAGMHVVSLPNPTHPNFIITASRSGIPGRLPEDARDLLTAMRMILAQLKGELAITRVGLAGYSLGATYAGFVGELDGRTHEIGIDRVLLMNPPVSLQRSARRLDNMFDRHVSTDPEGVRRFIDQIYGQLLQLYDRRQSLTVTDDFLYLAYSTIEPNDNELETLIGLAFRTTALNIALASDELNGGGYITPVNAHITATTSLTDVLISGIGLSFTDFVDDVYTPYFLALHPGVSFNQLKRDASLLPIESWLRTNPRVGLIGNADDVILRPDEVAWLEDVFKERAAIFPTGGHCGNMDQRDYVARMQRFFAR